MDGDNALRREPFLTILGYKQGTRSTTDGPPNDSLQISDRHAAGLHRNGDRRRGRQNPPDQPMASPLDNLKDAPKPSVLACSVCKDTAQLVAAFGVNVTFKDVDVQQCLTRRQCCSMPIRRGGWWVEGQTRTRPLAITVDTIDMDRPRRRAQRLTLRELEKLNGGNFSVTGFGGIGGGRHRTGGPFVNLPGDCSLKIRFEPGIASPLPPRFSSVTGDVLIVSTNLILRRVRPQVVQWSINYR